jgi:similar to spore coat protein
MNQDYLDPRNAEGMPNLADSAIALDFLLSVKNAIRNYAVAITESTNSELRKALRNQMEAAIDLHGEISELMMNKGWLHPYNVVEQFQLDMKSAQAAVSIAEMELFPGDTDRLGTFATPNK